jgi:phosphate:Na+ symporter
MDPAEITKMVFGIVGGLGIFLLGMKNMSEGMQAVAGSQLRRLINAVTNNRLIACGVGTAVTCLIQSSSVTTVMVVGMVNAEIMTLTQAIGVIMGANIGTTITGWILVLKVGKYGLPLIGFSAFFYLFSKRDRIRYTAALFLGLGMVFFGLELMKNGFAPIKSMPAFEAWFARFQPDSYIGILKCCLTGAILTGIVQSSSATLGITMGLAVAGIINFPAAVALVLGENIGTTVTAWLASLGASTNAKRASYAHIVLNVAGVTLVTLLFSIYIKQISWFVGHDPGMAVVVDGETTYPYVLKGIAIAHTGFNIFIVMLFLPLTGYLAKLLEKIVPEKVHREIQHLTAIDVRMLDTPVLAMQQSYKEIIKMGDGNEKMMGMLRTVLTSSERDEKLEEEIFNREKMMDVVQKEISEFLGTVMSGNISHDVITEGRNQLRMADEYESISDYATNILKLFLKMADSNEKISDSGEVEILDLHDHVMEYLRFINQGVRDENAAILSKAQTQGQAITYLMKKYRTTHLTRVGTGCTTPMKSLMYTDMLNAYRRIKDHSLNIAEVLAGEK